MDANNPDVNEPIVEVVEEEGQVKSISKFKEEEVEYMETMKNQTEKEPFVLGKMPGV